MATLHPLDANQLLRQMTADLGRPVTPAEGIAVAMALRLMADATPAATGVPHPSVVVMGSDLRALAGHIVTTIGLAAKVRAVRCGAMARPGIKAPDPHHTPEVVTCHRDAGHSGDHRSHLGSDVHWSWADNDPCVVGF